MAAHVELWMARCNPWGGGFRVVTVRLLPFGRRRGRVWVWDGVVARGLFGRFCYGGGVDRGQLRLAFDHVLFNVCWRFLRGRLHFLVGELICLVGTGT